MRMTRQAEIAIDVLVLCALKVGSTTPVTTGTAAVHAGTTKNHAAQVVARLSRNGYLVSERGRMGGLRLARPAAEINIGTVLRLADSAIGGVLGQGMATPAFAALHRAAWETYLATFDAFTIADLVAHPRHSRTNCLDCDLSRFVRHGRTMSRLHDHVDCRVPASEPGAGATP